MRHLLEAQPLSAALAGDAEGGRCAQAAPVDVWQAESLPEEFLREVVDTLAEFLRDGPEAYALKTGDATSES